MLSTSRAVREELRRDPRLVVLSTYQPPSLVEEAGRDRIRTLPIAEEAMTGMAVGAAMSGLHPLVVLHRASFLFVAMDPIVNQAAKMRYMSGGQFDVRLTIRVATRWADHLGPQHEQAPYALFLNVPGLKVVVPGTMDVAAGLLLSSLRDRDPVLFFESPSLWSQPDLEGEVEPVPLGRARVVREGSDVTLVAIGGGVALALEAAGRLAAEGVECAVVDPTTLAPLDADTIRASVRATGRCAIVDEAPVAGSAGAEIAAQIVGDEATRRALRGPVVRVGAAHVPVPFSPRLEEAVVPSSSDVLEAVRLLCGEPLREPLDSRFSPV